MSGPLGALTAETFLADYWQRKPLFIAGGYAGDDTEFGADDLAGLACEPGADARLVQGSFEAGDWRLRHGPFAERDFADLPERDWTLLVQDVEKHYPQLSGLVEQFGFVPGWRFDDLMISFAAPGGSVGPHVDQYDVFLVQLQGRRHWQIAESFSPERLADCPLDVLAQFAPQQEWTARPGDILYLPPGVAHHGVALEPCLTASVGMRAPTAAELLSSIAERAWNDAVANPRYGDPGLDGAPERPGEIDAAALRRARDLVRGVIANDTLIDDGFAQLVTGATDRFINQDLPETPPAKPGRDSLLQRNPWSRLAWLARDGEAQLFVNGEAYRCSIELASTLGGRAFVRFGEWRSRDREVLLRLLETGDLVFAESG